MHREKASPELDAFAFADAGRELGEGLDPAGELEPQAAIVVTAASKAAAVSNRAGRDGCVVWSCI
jgi:hypothetical protein